MENKNGLSLDGCLMGSTDPVGHRVSILYENSRS